VIHVFTVRLLPVVVLLGAMPGVATSGEVTSAPPKSQSSASEEESAHSVEVTELAKQLANPIATLVSFPFQLNVNVGPSPQQAASYDLHLQPILPIGLGSKFSLITRTILPVINQPSTSGESRLTGIGDMTVSFFLVPLSGTGFSWGVGPILSLPVASNVALGSEKLGVGPTVAVINQIPEWTVGLLTNQFWSVAGNANRAPVSKLLLQPFVTRIFHGGHNITLQSETTADWFAPSNRWTVPLVASISKTFKVGHQHMSLAVGGKYNIVRAEGELRGSFRERQWPPVRAPRAWRLP
jgi:hypothetical protein